MDRDDATERLFKACMEKNEEIRALNQTIGALKRGMEEMRGFCKRVEGAARGREDVTLFGVDYTPLPLDADGIPIHVGDWVDVDGGKRRVDAVAPHAVYWWEEDGCHWVDSFMVCHHRAPTVEDVLREFALACEDAGNAGPEVERIAAEFAKRLRLAGDE